MNLILENEFNKVEFEMDNGVLSININDALYSTFLSAEEVEKLKEWLNSKNSNNL